MTTLFAAILTTLLSQDPPYTELVEQKIRIRLRDDAAAAKAHYLNGERVEGSTATLRKGENRVLLASRIADKFRPENAGPFFRLTDGNGRRLTTIRYRAE